MLDKILAFISMASLVAFMGVVTVYINRPALWIIVVGVLAMGVYDFFVEIRKLDRESKKSVSTD